MIRAAILGLGRIGSRFGEDSKRKGIWSHAAAFAAIPEIELVAGADPDEKNRERFQRSHGAARVYADSRQLLEREKPDLVSICVPTPLHAELCLAAVDAGARALFCEKPITSRLADARGVVDACRAKGVVLAVNHTRRWDRLYCRIRQLIESGDWGPPTRLVAYYSAALLNQGTHLLDLMNMMVAATPIRVSGHFVGAGSGPDPSVSGWLEYPGGVSATMIALGAPQDLIFELEIFCATARIRVLANDASIEVYRFQESSNYDCYRELFPVPYENPLPQQDRFVGAVRDILRCMERGGAPACGGVEGLAALETALALRRSALSGGCPVDIPLDDAQQPA